MRGHTHRPASQLRALWALLVLSLISSPPASGQGIKAYLPQQRQTYASLLKNTQAAAAFRKTYAASPEAACNTKGGWCTARPGSENYQALLLATAPDVYDARKDTGDNYNPISPALDQRPCQTSVAFAVTAAAEAAAASALQTNGSSIQMSQQDLQFCPGLQRGCYDTWDIRAGLDRLVNSTVVDAECLPYTAPQSDDPQRLCNYRCNTPPKAVAAGKFGYKRFRDIEDAQKHIRRYGSFITRFNLYPDFFAWLGKTPGADPDAIYTCPNNLSPPSEAQAVTVVGYDNIKQAWLVKSSWGSAAGDKGFFRVKYGVCGTMASEDTYGVYYVPAELRKLDAVGFAPVTKASQGRQCIIYRARQGDTVAKIADRAVVSVGQLLADNTGVIKNLDKSIAGLRLKICGADPATINMPKRVSASPSPSPTPRKRKVESTVKPTTVKPTANTTAAATVAKSPAAPSLSPSPSPPPSPSPSPSPAPDFSEAEASVLLALKASLGDPPALSSWMKGTAPCGKPEANTPSWQQVYCGKFEESHQVYLLDLSELGLTGQLDDTLPLANLTRLQALWLSGNELTGSLPRSWGGIASLQEIKLDMNSLTGPLPAEWGSLSKLKKLFLNGNKISAGCPPEWRALLDLQQMFLASNSLTGTIPAVWSEMKSLAFCSLYDNEGLTGCLPFAWNARPDPVKLASGPENPDGTLTLTLSNTCLCGYCKDFASTECEGEPAARCATSGSSSAGNSTSGVLPTGGVNGTSAVAPDASSIGATSPTSPVTTGEPPSGTTPVTPVAPVVSPVTGPTVSPITPGPVSDAGTVPPVTGIEGTNSTAGGVPSASNGGDAEDPGAADYNPADYADYVEPGNGTPPSAAGMGSTESAQGEGGDSAARAAAAGSTIPTTPLAGSVPGGTTIPTNPIVVGMVPGSTVPSGIVPGSTVPGSTVPGSAVPSGTAPGSTVPTATPPGSLGSASAVGAPPATTAESAPGDLPSFGGLNSGKPTGSTADMPVAATLAPDRGSQVLMENVGSTMSSSSSGRRRRRRSSSSTNSGTESAGNMS